MTVSISEIKTYLRVDHTDEDELISDLISSAIDLCSSVARLLRDDFLSLDSNEAKIAVLYAVAYLYEHREEADHHQLTLTLRSLLFGVREMGF